MPDFPARTSFTPSRRTRTRKLQAAKQSVRPRLKWLFPRNLMRGIRADWCTFVRDFFRVLWIALLLIGGEGIIDFFRLHGGHASFVKALEVVLILAIVWRWLRSAHSENARRAAGKNTRTTLMPVRSQCPRPNGASRAGSIFRKIQSISGFAVEERFTPPFGGYLPRRLCR